MSLQGVRVRSRIDHPTLEQAKPTYPRRGGPILAEVRENGL